MSRGGVADAAALVVAALDGFVVAEVGVATLLLLGIAVEVTVLVTGGGKIVEFRGYGTPPVPVGIGEPALALDVTVPFAGGVGYP